MATSSEAATSLPNGTSSEAATYSTAATSLETATPPPAATASEAATSSRTATSSETTTSTHLTLHAPQQPGLHVYGLPRTLAIRRPKALFIHQPERSLSGNDQAILSWKIPWVEGKLRSIANQYPVTIQFFRSNSEQAVAGRIQAARDENPPVDAVIIFPGYFAFTGRHILEILRRTRVPFIEVYLENHFRTIQPGHNRVADRSIFSEHADTVISGLGWYGYEAALTRFMLKCRIAFL